MSGARRHQLLPAGPAHQVCISCGLVVEHNAPPAVTGRTSCTQTARRPAPSAPAPTVPTTHTHAHAPEA